MSTALSFLVRSAQREQSEESSRDQSVFRDYELSMQDGGIGQPVTLIQTLSKLGPGLNNAHQLVNRITDGETVRTRLSDAQGNMCDILREFGVNAVLR